MARRRSARVYWIWAVCGFLLLAVGLVFGQTASHDFIAYDDNIFVYQNPHVTEGLTTSGLWWALTDGPLGDWYPLTGLSHMLDCQLYGLNPAGHHLTNVSLHAASAVLLFLVLLRATRDLWPSAWVAAVFAVHPLHVESVAWVAERRDMLSGLFFMLTLGAYTMYAERPSLARYLAVAALLALGLMSKPMLVTVPFLLLLLDYWPLDRFRRTAADPATASRSWLGRLPVGWRLAFEKVPLLALAAVDCGIVVATHLAFRSDDIVEPLPMATRLANAAVSYAAYVGQSFYPVDLSPFYPYLGAGQPVARVAGSLALLLAITAIAAHGWRRRPYVLVGWLWFLGMLVPVIGLVRVSHHARADRYTYLSQIGLSIALAWTVWTVYQSQSIRRPTRWGGRLLAGVSVATVLLLALVAWRQTSYWRDTEAVWTRALACTDPNVMARFNLAVVYVGQEKTAAAIDQLREAVAEPLVDQQVLALCHLLLADILTQQGKLDEALEHYGRTVQLYPAGPRGHLRLAMALASAGRHDQSIAEWRQTLRLAPAFWSARIGLADALLASGDAAEAAVQCREALERQPGAVEAIVILAEALVAQGEAEQAIPHFQQALELEPNNARAHFHLGLALCDLGRAHSALVHLNEAMRLQPDDVQMLWQAAWALATSRSASVRDGARAVELATKAVELSGGQEPHAFDALAAALAETGNITTAIETAEQASTIALLRNDQALADAIDRRTLLYRQGLPYRQPATLSRE